ncbi:MAG: DUF2793 domain-containing protein [Caulobacter sp.]|nr:DUF2793 domain-containing protein [Caulobacter sp.]
MSDDATPRLGLPYVAAGQAQKHVTVNEAFARLDGLVQTAVVSRSLAVEPADPDDGALYILPGSATGEVWAGAEEGALIRFEAGGWQTVARRAGHLVWVSDETLALVFDGDDWRPLADFLAFEALDAATAPSGGRTRFAILEEDVTLAGATASTSMVIPARAIVFAVATRTLTAIIGATAYDCGLTGEPAKFGGALGAAAGSTNVGVIGPTAFYADSPVLLTGIGGDFTGGTVRVAIHLIQFDAPGA